MKLRNVFILVYLSAAICALFAMTFFILETIYFPGTVYAAIIITILFPVIFLISPHARPSPIIIPPLLIALNVGFIVLVFRFDIFTQNGLIIDSRHLHLFSQILIAQGLSFGLSLLILHMTRSRIETLK